MLVQIKNAMLNVNLHFCKCRDKPLIAKPKSRPKIRNIGIKKFSAIEYFRPDCYTILLINLVTLNILKQCILNKAIK